LRQPRYGGSLADHRRDGFLFLRSLLSRIYDRGEACRRFSSGWLISRSSISAEILLSHSSARPALSRFIVLNNFPEVLHFGHVTVIVVSCMRILRLSIQTPRLIAVASRPIPFDASGALLLLRESSTLAMTNYRCRYWSRQAIRALVHIRKQKKIKGSVRFPSEPEKIKRDG
jgi:hypothetical protein